MGLRVVLYARVSSQRQAEKQLSISAQLRALRAYAHDKGWDVAGEYVDEAKSGRTADRPAFTKMLHVVRSGGAEAIFVWKIDRLARNMEISVSLDSFLRRYGAKVISLHEPIDDTPQGKLTARIFESLAEFYSNNLSQDIQRGNRELARRGFYPFSHAPVGYLREPVSDGGARRFRLVPDPVYGPLLTRIFRLYLDGETAPRIAGILNQEGLVSSTGRHWWQKQLYDILRNRVYCGDITVGRLYQDASGKHVPGSNPILVENVHPALVSREDFLRVQRILASRSHDMAFRRQHSSPYLLSGLARCGLCGRHLTGTSAKGGRFRYYTCQQYHREGKEACAGVRVPQKRLEQFVLSRVRDVILDEDNLSRLVELVNEELQGAGERAKAQLEPIERQVQALKARLARHYEALETGLLVLEDVAQRIKELREAIAAAEARRETVLEAKTRGMPSPVRLATVLRHAKGLRETLSSATLSERRAFLSGVVKEIRVDRAKVEIEYRIPAPKGETDGDLPSVLTSVTSGGGGGSRTRVRRDRHSASTSLRSCFGFGQRPPTIRMAHP